MNYLWEAVIKASEEEIPPDQLKFKMARRFSGYLELSNPYLNQESIKANNRRKFGWTNKRG